MKFFLINILVLITSHSLVCYSKLTSQEFTLKLLQSSLNSSKDNENFVIAPYEAFNLYEEIFPTTESNEINDNSNEILTASSTMSAIIKQQKLLPSTSSNNKEEGEEEDNSNLQNLLSTISLKAKWSFNFQTRDIQKRLFHQLGSVDNKIFKDYLRKDAIFRYHHDEQLNASILELPLNVNELRLLLILPDEWEKLPELKEYFVDNMDELEDITTKSYIMKLVRVHLPKFHISHKMDLTDFYEELSSKDVENYHHIHQVSNLDFNERGIGRFEKTTVLFWNSYSYLRISPEIFDVTHPFLFIITNMDGVQFFGQVVKMHN